MWFLDKGKTEHILKLVQANFDSEPIAHDGGRHINPNGDGLDRNLVENVDIVHIAGGPRSLAVTVRNLHSRQAK